MFAIVKITKHTLPLKDMCILIPRILNALGVCKITRGRKPTREAKVLAVCTLGELSCFSTDHSFQTGRRQKEKPQGDIVTEEWSVEGSFAGFEENQRSWF